MCGTESEARETQVTAGTGLESRGHQLLFLSAINMAVAEQVLCEQLLMCTKQKTPRQRQQIGVCNLVSWFANIPTQSVLDLCVLRDSLKFRVIKHRHTHKIMFWLKSMSCIYSTKTEYLLCSRPCPWHWEWRLDPGPQGAHSLEGKDT